MYKRFIALGLALAAGMAAGGCQLTLPPGTAASAPAPAVSEAPQGEYVPPRATSEEVMQRLKAGESMVIVDVRSKGAYDEEHIEGAVSHPWSELRAGHAQLPKDRLILLYCT